MLLLTIDVVVVDMSGVTVHEIEQVLLVLSPLLYDEPLSVAIRVPLRAPPLLTRARVGRGAGGQGGGEGGGVGGVVKLDGRGLPPLEVGRGRKGGYSGEVVGQGGEGGTLEGEGGGGGRGHLERGAQGLARGGEGGGGDGGGRGGMGDEAGHGEGREGEEVGQGEGGGVAAQHVSTALDHLNTKIPNT